MIEKIEDNVLIKEIKKYSHKKKMDVYLVGGCVRDLVLGKDSLDFDFVLTEDPYKFIEGTPFEPIRYYKKFLTLKVKYQDYIFDMARTRKEIYPTPGALPVVSPGTLEEDAIRRDFSINAIYVSLKSGEVYDPFNGIEDINNRIIRVLHENSFMDDPTRILRGLRLKHRLNFKFEEKTRKLLIDAINKGFLKRVSGDRIYHEFLLISREPKRKHIIKEAEKLGIISLSEREFLDSDLKAEDFLLSLLSFSDMIERYSPNLKNEEKEVIRTLINAKNFCKKIGKVRTNSEIYLVCEKENMKALKIIGSIYPEYREPIENYINKLSHIETEIKGEELRRMGFEGEKIGEILKELKLGKMDGKIKDERAYLKKLIKEEDDI